MRILAAVLSLATLLCACATTDAEREYFKGRFDQAIALAAPERRAKYEAMQAFTMGGDWPAVIERAAGAVSEASSDGARAEALTWEAFARYAHAMTGGGDDYAMALERADEALALRRRIGEPRGMAEALFYRGLIIERARGGGEARALYEEALAIAQRHDLSLEESYAQRHLGFLDQASGDVASARARLERSLRLRERAGFDVFLPFSVLSLAELDVDGGDFEAAEARFQRAASMAGKLGFPRLAVLIDLGWARLREREGRHDEARALLVRARDASEQIGYRRGVMIAEERLSAGREK